MFRSIDREWGAVPDMVKVVAALSHHQVELSDRPS
jgi:hypothetical protein